MNSPARCSLPKYKGKPQWRSTNLALKSSMKTWNQGSVSNPRGQIHNLRNQNQIAPMEDPEHIPVDPARPKLEVTIGT
ncbi:hypothetical protein ACS0TY_007071 [Phlomoides rotata]